MNRILISLAALSLSALHPAQAQESAPVEPHAAAPDASPPGAGTTVEERMAAFEEMLNRPATPYVLGAIKLDPSRLTVATGQVKRGQSIFTGTAQHAQIGRLTAELNLRDALQNDDVPVGTPMYLVEFVTRDGGARAADSAPWRVTAVWCGNLDRKTIFGTPSPSLCLFDNDPALLLLGTRRAYMSMQSRPWITTSATTMNSSLAANNFQIERGSDQPFGPMDVRLEVSQVRERQIRLTLFAAQADDDVVVMRFVLPVENGQATLPFWNHQLRFVVGRNSVTPSFSSDGDGSSPIPFGTYPA